MEAVTPTPLQWNVPQVWAHASRSEESEMSEPPRLRSAEYSVSMKRGSETSELNAVGRVNVYTRKGKGREGSEKGCPLHRDTARAESARPSNGGGQKTCRRVAQRHITSLCYVKRRH